MTDVAGHEAASHEGMTGAAGHGAAGHGPAGHGAAGYVAAEHGAASREGMTGAARHGAVSHSVLLRAWLLNRSLRDRRRERLIGRLIVVIALLLAVWTVWLGSSLPPDPLRQQWSTASLGLDNYSLTWVGLDCLEVLGLALCGLLFARGTPGARTCALLTMPVFFLDAWFDILTAVTRADLVESVLMAALGELPAVVGLGWIAWKAAAFGRKS